MSRVVGFGVGRAGGDVKVSFDGFSFDASSRLLLRDRTAVHLTLKAFDLLALLIERRPAAVSKEDIQAHLWPDTFVSEANLPSLVAEIRTALGETARKARFIRTVHRFGYSFCGKTQSVDEPPVPRRRARYSLAWEAHILPLFEGANVIGRDRDAAVFLDSSSVSRRHCVITVADAVVTVEDLDSKNGTYVRDERVSAPAPVGPGERIRIGSLLVTLRQDDGASTETESSHDDAGRS